MSRILVFLYFWIKLDYYLLKLIILEYLERVSQQHMVHLFWMVKLVTIHKSPIWTWNSYLFQIFSSDSKFSSNFNLYLCLNWICLNIPWIFFWIYTFFFFNPPYCASPLIFLQRLATRYRARCKFIIIDTDKDTVKL